MSAHIDYLTQEIDGQHYAMLSLDQFTALVEQAGKAYALTLPHEVVSLYLVEDVSLIRARREYLSISQKELAQRLGVPQPKIAQWERPETKPRQATLKKIAAAMGIHVRQLSLPD